MKKFQLKPVLLATLWLLLAAANSHAFSSAGPTAYTAKQQGQNGMSCGGCHGGPKDASVSITGPAQLFAGQTGTYSISVARALAATGTRAGINVAVDNGDAGALGVVPGEPTAVSNNEIVHTTANTALKTIPSAGAPAVYQFKYTMPANAALNSNHTIYGVGDVGRPGGWNFAPNFTVVTVNPPAGAAGTYFVNAATGNNANDGSQNAPFKTITFAMTAATSGRIISVAPGTYNSALGESFPITVKSNVQIIGTTAANTIVDATGSNKRVFICNGNIDGTLIENLTIKGGVDKPASPTVAQGGAIQCINNDHTTIDRNIITGNQAVGFIGPQSAVGGDSNGGAIYVGASSPSITNNVIVNNVARGGEGHTVPFNGAGSATVGGTGAGGAIYVLSGAPTIVNNTFDGNSAIGGEGGISITTAVGRDGGPGNAGAAFLGGTTSFVNNIVSNNVAQGGAKGNFDANDGSASNGGVFNSGTATVDHTLFFNNTANAVDSNGTTGTNATLGQNPQYTSATDYHLTAMSPALGSGTATGAPEKDFDNKLRANPPSIGAYDLVTPALSLALTPPNIVEGNNSSGRVTRNTSTFSALLVNLGSSDVVNGSVPISVTIPAGQAFVDFTITSQDNALVDGPRTATITASAAGFTTANAVLTVADNETPTLTLVLNKNSVSEAAGINAATATVSRNGSLASDITINLSSNDTTEATVPSSITLLAGSSSTTFAVDAIDDPVADGPQNVVLTATSAGYNPGTANLVVTDNDTAGITVAPSSGLSTTETGGVAVFSVVLTSQPTSSVSVGLTSSDTTEGTVSPASVSFTTGNWNVPQNVIVTGLADGIADGNQNYTIVTAPAVSADANYGGLNAIDASVTNIDANGGGGGSSTLSMLITPAVILEKGGTATGTLALSSAAVSDLTVNLSSNKPTAATVPASVVIPAGESSVNFTVTAVDNTLADGNRTVTITRTAAGFPSASSNVTVADDEKPALTLDIAPAIFRENAAGAAQGVVTRNSSTTLPLSVSLTSSDISEVKVPPTVIIPAGATRVSFVVTAVNDAIADGPQNAVITTRATGFANVAKAVTVTDDEVPTIKLSIAPPAFSESAGATAAKGTVTRNTPTTTAMSVALSSSDLTEAKVPAVVLIPVGATSATFDVAAVNDATVDGSQSVVLTARASGVSPVTAALTVSDDEANSLNLSISPSVVIESAVTAAVRGTIKLSAVRATALTLSLASSDTTEATVPATVTIPAGALSAIFSISPIDDEIADGPQNVTISATGAGLPIAKAALQITDNEVPALTLSVTPAAFSEGAGAVAARGTITRNTSTATPLAVAIRSSDTTEAAVPASVIIPAGASSATFNVAAVNDVVVDGDQRPVITATATGFAQAVSAVTVLDNEGPTLQLSVSPATASEGGGAAAAKATLRRVGTTTAPLVVAIRSSDLTEATVPVTVTIPANATSVQFNVAAVNDTIADGVQAVTLTAAAAGYNGAAANLNVTDNETAKLTLTAIPSSFSEAGGAAASRGTVTRNTATTAPLRVTLTSANLSEAAVPATVVIPAGALSVSFNIAAVDDAVVDGSKSVLLKAAATGLALGSVTVTVTDNDVATQVAAGASTVSLSVASARSVDGVLQLTFNGPLDADAATDASHYAVTVNGQSIEIEICSYNATTHTVQLGVAPASLQAGETATVTWNGLFDGNGQAVGAGRAEVVVR